MFDQEEFGTKTRRVLATLKTHVKGRVKAVIVGLNSPCQNRRFSASRKSFGIDVNGGKLEAHDKESARRA